MTSVSPPSSSPILPTKTAPIITPPTTSKIPPKLQTPSLLARYTCAAISTAIFSIWFQFTFSTNPHQVHSYHTPLFLTTFYLLSLPVLKYIVESYIAPTYDMRAYLKESMVLYNVAQVVLNGWMVWRFVDAVVMRGHPFVGDLSSEGAGTGFVIWVHYCDKYLEFFDTYFMVLRGRMDQVSFLHVYHHFSITWAWYIAINLWPGGDSYFGALLNSFIHVLMYSYYALALLKISCPWKRFLTQAQLLQFTTVVIYSAFSMALWPKDEWEWKHVLCIGIQVWEMGSLFVLFYFFYRRSYGKAKSSSSSSATGGKGIGKKEDGQCAGSTAEDDQCQVAVKAGVNGAAQAVESAAEVRVRVVVKEQLPGKAISRKSVW